jgi:hypothetical protein
MERHPPGREDDPRPLRTVAGSEKQRRFDPDQLFWRQFAEAKTPREFCQSWLPLQCRMLKGIRCAMVLLGEADSGPYTPVAVWPDAKLSMHHLTGAAENALKERRGLLIETDRLPTPENPSPENPANFTVWLFSVSSRRTKKKCRRPCVSSTGVRHGSRS